MRIDRHIFGSVHGYQTLARTDGITDADLRILEALSVGAAASSSLLAALAANPAYIVLPLGSRRAVTRVSVGDADDQGRPTLQQVTAAVPKAQWDGVLNGDLLSLVRCRDIWQWDGRPVIQPITLPDAGSRGGTTSPESAEKILAMLSLLERGISRSRPILVREQDFSLEEFSLLERLLPPSARAGMALVYRAFGANVPGSVVCIANEVSSIPSDGLYRPGQPVEPSLYAQAVAQAGFQLGQIPEGFVRSYRSFGVAAQRRTPVAAPVVQAPPTTVVVERMPMGMMVTMMVTCIVLAMLVGVCTWWLTRSTAERSYRAQEAELKRSHTAEVGGLQAKLQNATKEAARAEEEHAAEVKVLNTDKGKEIQSRESVIDRQNKAIEELRDIVKSLVKHASLPIDKVQRQEAMAAYRLVVRASSDGTGPDDDVKKRVDQLIAQQATMDKAESALSTRNLKLDVSGSLSVATTRPASEEFSAYYMHICEVDRSPSATAGSTLSRNVTSASDLAGTDTGTDGDSVTNNPAPSTPAANRTGGTGEPNSSPSQPRRIVALAVPQAVPSQRYIEVLERVNNELNETKALVDKIRTALDEARKSIVSIDDPKDKRGQEEKKFAAVGKIASAVNLLEQWKTVLKEERHQAVCLPWLDKEIDVLRSALPGPARLDGPGGVTR